MSEDKYFSDQTFKVLEYFETWLYSMPPIEGGDFDKRSIFCELFDVFHEREGGTSTLEMPHHNCIGCNFDEGCLTILEFLKRFSGSTNMLPYLTIYTLLFYAQAERMGVIYKELGYVSRDNFDWGAFPNLALIKHWANFFKHPKAYMYLHHPTYHIETDPGRPNFMLNGIIDTQFVQTFYRAGADNKKLAKHFEKGTSYTVFFPDLLELTKNLCQAFQDIIPIIKKIENIEVLRKYTVQDWGL